MRNQSTRLSAVFASASLALVAIAPVAVHAQSDPTLDVWARCSLTGNSACDDYKRVGMISQDGGFLIQSTLGIGAIPASGPGDRVMWHPFRAAFRAGAVSGTQWDDNNVGFYSFAGGSSSMATAFASFAYGDQVEARGVDSAVFGANSVVTGTVGFSSGASNVCSGFACVAMGFTMRAEGQGATALGYRSLASGDYTIAIGQRATSCAESAPPLIASNGLVNGACPNGSRTGSITFADSSTTSFVGSTANNQFSVRAAGGYRLYTNSALTAGVTMNAGGATWNALSDRAAKENIAEFDGEDLLAGIARLPLNTWRYIEEEDTSVRHIGPMAQDWQTLIAGPLGLNAEDRLINQGDFDGVNLAAIKALEARTRALAEANAELRRDNDALGAAVAEMQQQRMAQADRLQALEALVTQLALSSKAGAPLAGQ